MAKRLLGIDPSLCSTGIVIIDEEKNIIHSDTFGYSLQKSSGLQRTKRLAFIGQKIISLIKEYDVSYIAIEGPGINARGKGIGNQLQLLELFGVIKTFIFLYVHKDILIIPPMTWKKEIIGHGHSSKEDIKSFFENQNIYFQKQDCYDALGVVLFLLKKLRTGNEGN